jgi:2-polyprenyl-3-methyl-5-hydroxy-6-metoxy-1,4-benzoquinol methylase
MNADDERAELFTGSVSDYLNAISSREDILRHELLLPELIDLIGDVAGRRILDAGCGDGTLVELLTSQGAVAIGVDSAAEMAQIASSRVGEDRIHEHDITTPLPGHAAAEPFDGIVANMVFHCLDRIDSALEALAGALRTGGWLVFSILHPAFHQSPEQITALKRLTEEGGDWSFRVTAPYLQEIRFQKTIADSPVTVTHIHRPISEYMNALAGAGFAVEAIREPLLAGPSSRIPRYYHASVIPRFLLVRARLCFDSSPTPLALPFSGI